MTKRRKIVLFVAAPLLLVSAWLAFEALNPPTPEQQGLKRRLWHCSIALKTGEYKCVEVKMS